MPLSRLPRRAPDRTSRHFILSLKVVKLKFQPRNGVKMALTSPAAGDRRRSGHRGPESQLHCQANIGELPVESPENRRFPEYPEEAAVPYVISSTGARESQPKAG